MMAAIGTGTASSASVRERDERVGAGVTVGAVAGVILLNAGFCADTGGVASNG